MSTILHGPSHTQDANVQMMESEDTADYESGLPVGNSDFSRNLVYDHMKKMVQPDLSCNTLPNNRQNDKELAIPLEALQQHANTPCLPALDSSDLHKTSTSVCLPEFSVLQTAEAETSQNSPQPPIPVHISEPPAAENLLRSRFQEDYE